MLTNLSHLQQFTLAATISVNLSLPDSKLKAFLEGDIDITNYLQIENSDVSKDYRGFSIEDCGIEIEDLDTSDVESTAEDGAQASKNRTATATSGLGRS